jgi:hypothetical protein
MLYAFFTSFMQATCPVHFSLLLDHKVPHYAVLSTLVGPNIFLRTLGLCSSPRARDQLSCLGKQNEKLLSSAFRFLSFCIAEEKTERQQALSQFNLHLFPSWMQFWLAGVGLTCPRMLAASVLWFSWRDINVLFPCRRAYSVACHSSPLGHVTYVITHASFMYRVFILQS